MATPLSPQETPWTSNRRPCRIFILPMRSHCFPESLMVTVKTTGEMLNLGTVFLIWK